MRITGPSISKVLRTYSKQNKDHVKQSKPGSKDTIELSAESKLYTKALQELKNLPEVRQEKVESIRERLRQGTYNISADDVVRKMLDHYSVNKEL